MDKQKAHILCHHVALGPRMGTGCYENPGGFCYPGGGWPGGNIIPLGALLAGFEPRT